MRYFTVSGLWFLGDDPKNRVAGTLRYSGHGLRLRLLGGFRGGWSPKADPYPLIHGVVSRNPYGEFVTLTDCFTKRTRMSSAGIGSETIRCNRGIAGDSHLRPDFDEFEALDVRISYLDDWFGRRGITSQIVPDEGFGLDARYRSPEPVRFPIDQSSLKIWMKATWSESSHRLTLMEEGHIFIEPLPRLTAQRVHSEIVRPLQNLLSFATDRPNAVEEIQLHGEKIARGKSGRNRSYRLLYEPIFRLRRKKDRLAPDDMLFNFNEVQEAGLNIFEKWFEFTKSHEAFCTVYFASLYAPPRYLEEKFLRLMSALALLTASLGDVSPRTSLFLEELHRLTAIHFGEEERVLIAPNLPTGPQIEMPFRLLGILEEHKTIMRQIVGDDFPGFVKSLLDTLGFVERRTQTTDQSPIQGDDLYRPMQSIHMLIKVVMLRRLGFTEGGVSRFIERNKQFVHMRVL
jgi:hypothetical protein